MKIKIIGALMALIMLISSVSVGAVSDIKDGSESRSVKLLNALGIMGIDESTSRLWDNNLVERRELARILCSMLKLSPKADEAPRFVDVKEEDRPYIETVASYGYMNGVSHNEFAPKAFVSREQLIKIFVSVLGADEFAKMMGGYPNGYVQIARRLKIMGGINGSLNENATRIEVANIIYDALHVDIPTLAEIRDKTLVYQMQEGHTFLSENLDIYKGSGIVSGNSVTMVSNPTGVNEGLVMIGGVLYKDPSGLTEEKLGYDVTVYAHRPDLSDFGEIVYIEDNHSNTSLRISSDDFIAVNDFTLKFYKNDKETTEKLASVCNMIYNGKYVTYNPKYYDGFDGYIDFVDNNGDGYFDVAKITDFKTFVISKINIEEEKLVLEHGYPTVILKDNYANIYLDGEKVTIDKLGAGMVINVAMSEGDGDGKAVRVEASAKRLIGTVNKVYKKAGKRYISLSGNDYPVSEYCEELISKRIIEDIEGGKTAGQFFVDFRGNLVYHAATQNDNLVGYLTASTMAEDGFDNTLMVKIFTAEGKIETYSTNKKIIIDGVSRTVQALEKEYDILNKLQTPQLVEYNVTDGVIKKINFAVEGYDLQKFSKDAPSSTYEHYSSTLNHRYGVTAKTQVFKVPKANKNASNFMSIMNEETNFEIHTGSYFTRARGHNNVTLYDVAVDGEVKYIVLEYDPAVSTIRYSDQTMVVESVNDGIDENGNSITVLTGYDENGNYIEIESPDSKDATIDSVYARQVKSGDVVQFNKDINEKLAYVKIRKNVDLTDFTAIENVDWEYYMFISYGQVYKIASEKLYLTTNPLTENMTPLDTSMMVSDTGKAIYKYDSENQKIHKIGFNEIEYGDKVYACVNDRNYARMIVVYD